MIITALLTIAKLWEPRRPTTDERIVKLWYTCTMEYFSATRNNDMGFEGKWMQLEEIMLSEVRNTKDACFLSYMEEKHVHKNRHDHIQTKL
jgi:hypothetical protein